MVWKSILCSVLASLFGMSDFRFLYGLFAYYICSYLFLIFYAETSMISAAQNIPFRTSSTPKFSTSNCVHIADLITTCCQVDSIMLLSR